MAQSPLRPRQANQHAPRAFPPAHAHKPSSSRGLQFPKRLARKVNMAARIAWLVRRSRPQRAAGPRGLCAAASSSSSKPACFTHPDVQSILKKITGINLEKVFQPVKQESNPPVYKLMTQQQYEESLQKAVKVAQQHLEMPPMLSEREPIDESLAVDEILDGTDTAKFVFTDITFTIPHDERFIVVREPNGVLRKATWEERDRMIQVYFPRRGRKIVPPPVFRNRNLKILFQQDRHEELLNRSLVQFEVDSADYIRIRNQTFEDIDRQGKYDLLRSTRHFGGMVWQLCSQKHIDGLLADMLQRDLLEDAVCLVRLYHMVHPDTPCAKESQGADGTELIKLFVKMEAQKAGYLELALQVYAESAAASS